MSDEIVDPLAPAHEIAAVPEFEARLQQAPLRQPALLIPGHIVAITPGRPHPGEQHQLDVTVGGSPYTEILLRVPNGHYGNIEGREVRLHVEHE